MAANKEIRRISVYIGSKLITEQETAKYGHATNDEQGHGHDGAQYFSIGNDTTTVDFTTMTPRIGHEATEMKQACIDHTDVTLALLVDGALERVTGKLVNRDYDSDSKSGMVKCSWKFMGGAPEVVSF